MSESYRLVELTADSFKRLKAVRIQPGNGVTPIVGRNGAGKTSVLDAVSAALGGGSEQPAMPIRRGAKSATIVANLGDLVVRRKFTAGGSTLEVTAADGSKINSPQKVLDTLFSRLSFDPLAFMRMKPSEQRATLGQVAGINLDERAAKRKALFDERTAVNRNLKTAEAQLAALPVVNAPDAEVSVAAISQQLNDAHKHNADSKAAADRKAQAVRNVQTQVSNIAELEEELREARNQLARLEMYANDLPAPAAPIDVSEFQKQLATAEQTNQQVRAKKQRAAKAADVDALAGQANDLTRKLEVHDAAQAEILAASKLPVDGLSISDTDVTFNGIPLGQCSGAEQLRVSLAIGIALNPKLKLMLIRDGSLLDADGMALVAEMAEQHGAQVLIERVANGREVGVVIEDGEVVSNGLPAEKQVHELVS